MACGIPYGEDDMKIAIDSYPTLYSMANSQYDFEESIALLRRVEPAGKSFNVHTHLGKVNLYKGSDNLWRIITKGEVK